MKSAQAAFDRLLHVCATLIQGTPTLHGFATVPNDLQYVHRKPVHKPVSDYLTTHMPTASASTQALVDALLVATPHAEWRTTYTADQVGIDFFNRYGFIELYGPEGHYVSEQSRAFIGYWGNQLYYPPHSHEAEELYYIVAGEALFAVDDDAVQSSALQNSALRNPALRNPALRNRDSQLRSPEDSQTHGTCQPHSMTTQDSAVLCLVLWRGAGLAGSARLND